MGTRSKAKASQESPVLPFIEEAPESKANPIPPVPDFPDKPDSPEPPDGQTAELIKAIKRIGKMKSDAGKLHEPEPFTSRDPKKLKPFIFQCQLYFRSSSDFDDESKRVTFVLSYLWDAAQDWF